MARKTKSDNGGATAVTMEQAGVTVDVAVHPTDPHHSPAAAEGTRLPAGATATVPKKRSRPRAGASPSRQQTRRANDLIDEATARAKALHDEASEVREQLQSAVVEARQRADEALRLIEEARSEVELARKQHEGGADQGRQALDEVLEFRRRAAEECLLLEQLEHAATRRQEELESVRRDLEAQAHGFLEEMRQELQAIRQTHREARAQLDAARREQERAWGFRQPAPARAAAEPTPAPAAPAEPTPASAAPAEPTNGATETVPVIHATVRAENPGDRLVRYLQTSLAVKAAVLDELHELGEETIDPTLRAALGEHRQLTQRQKRETEDRLRALGAEPRDGGGKGVLRRFVGWVWESWQQEPDDFDRAVQSLLKALAAEQFEADLHHAVAALATAVGDTPTAELAARHAVQKGQAVEQMRPLLEALAEQAVRVAEATTQAVVALAVAAAEEDR